MTDAPSASSSIEIDATPQTVYDLITNLPTLTEVAAETTAMTWKTGTYALPGSVFRGSNRNGWRRWSTTCTVTDATTPRRFAFEVRHTVFPVSRWQFDLEPLDDGSRCRVVESTWDRRPRWFKLPAELATGVRNRPVANTANIQATLRRLKDRAESH